MNETISRHIVRFGIHADSDSLELTKDCYGMIIFNANMVQYTTHAIGSLIMSRLDNKPYIIDPGTHAFAQDPQYIVPYGKDPNPENVKLSLKGLAESYGLELGNPIGNRPLNVSDFDDIISIEQFTLNVINFQKNKLLDELHDDLKYIPRGLQISLPHILVAPYFFMSPKNLNAWLPINTRLVEVARSIENEQKLFAELVISAELLRNSEAVEKIIRAYSKLVDYDGILLWVSNFEEHRRPLDDLRALRDFVHNLARLDRPIINMFGGYFSIMLTKFGLSGVSHGPGYGEHRHIVPVGGGPPTQRYHFTPVHERLDYATVQFFIDRDAWGSAKEFEKEVCKCAVCKSVIKGNLENFSRFGETEFRIKDDGSTVEVMTSRARNLLKAHFIEAKAQEHQFVADQDIDGLIDQLRAAKNKYSGYLGPTSFNHLDLWSSAIGSDQN